MAAHVDDTREAGVLVRSAAAGDGMAWSHLVQRFSGLVWSIARSYGLRSADAEEVFQTTWLRLTEHLSRIKDPERVGAWLATTARHESLRVIRVGGRVHATDDPYLLDPAATRIRRSRWCWTWRPRRQAGGAPASCGRRSSGSPIAAGSC